jgi:LAS superfamily LD-carboxypeptidase LdcB
VYKRIIRHPLLWFGLAVIAIGVALYSGYRSHVEKQKLKALQSELSEAVATYQSQVLELRTNLTLTEQERAALMESAQQKEMQLASLEAASQKLGIEVSSYQKLRSLDLELLQKYSKVYFLNEHYVPSALTKIDPLYTNGVARTIHASVWPFLKDLLEQSRKDGVHLIISSSYRSFGEQSALKSQYKVIYGTTAANQFSADQGYSEHQLGTTVDFATTRSSGLSTSFENTPEFTWLNTHAYEYGFVMSYPKNNTYYVYEPWHWRFVGVSLAKRLHDQNKQLYELDQRDINDYLITIFDK